MGTDQVPEADAREHSETAAEGDENDAAPDSRIHSEDAAEGPETE